VIFRLIRDQFHASSTLGRLLQDDKPFGYVVEDEDRGLHAGMSLAEIAERKVRAETAIPIGRYRVLRTWSPKYQALVPEVLDVPGFRGIRIHSGNDESHTEGCILPGMARLGEKVQRSRVACDWIYARIAECESKGEPAWKAWTERA
jgi:hypothetical protein